MSDIIERLKTNDGQLIEIDINKEQELIHFYLMGAYSATYAYLNLSELVKLYDIIGTLIDDLESDERVKNE